MMLDGDNIDSTLVAQHELVKGFLEQVGSNPWVAIFIRQAGPDGVGAIEHVLWDKGIRVFVMKPDFHGVVLSLRAQLYSSFFQEGSHALNKSLGLLDLRMVSRLSNDIKARAGNQRAVGLPVGWCHNPVARSP